ncbi:MAG: 23S rRNA (pseudouridine(1915)-N(3))-methyltransferase RlmH [Robiginitalea sp.]
MKLVLLTVGKTDSAPLKTLIADFSGRLKRYIPFELEAIPDIRGGGKLSPEMLREREAAQVLKRIQSNDVVWLLDETGKEFTSRGFAAHIQKAMNTGPKRLVLVIGGAYGHGESLKRSASQCISLSKMTFNHQVVRLLAVEQLYRAFSILRGDPYHND